MRSWLKTPVDRPWIRCLPSLLGAAMLSVAVALQVDDGSHQPLQFLQDKAYDWLLAHAPRPYEPLPVVIALVDEASLQAVGAWPWPRALLAQLMERLTAAGVAAVAFDVIFDAPDSAHPQRLLAGLTGDFATDPAWRGLLARLPDNDQRFAQALGRGPAVIGAVLTHRGAGQSPVAADAWPTPGVVLIGGFPQGITTFSDALTPLAVLAGQASVGALNVYPTPDGRVRRVPVLLRRDQTLYPSLAVEALRLALGQRNYVLRRNDALAASAMTLRLGPLFIPLNERGEIWLNATWDRPERYYPAHRLLDPDVDLSPLEGAIVLVGTEAIGLGDRQVSPLGEAVPGVAIHAQVLEQLLLNAHVLRPPWAEALELWLQLGLGLGLAIAVGWLGILTSAGVCGLLVAGQWWAAHYAFGHHGLIFDPLTPTLTLVGVFSAVALARHWQSERQRRFIRQAFASYVPPALVEHLLQNPRALRVGGERRHCSFVFTDLANFTPLVEDCDPERLVAVLNAYLEAMIDIAFRHQGTVDKLMGDAVLVMFSAPVTQLDHAHRAIRCALAMDGFAVAFADRQRALGIPFGHTRIGVHSGVVTVGNFGGQKRFDYTAVGDAINTAARLEGANEGLGTRICLSEEVVAHQPSLPKRPVGKLLLKGKRRAVAVFEPWTRPDPEYLANYCRAYGLLSHAPTAAQGAFQALASARPDDPLVQFYLRRLGRGQGGVEIDLG
ncbi:MAG: CHASE2 domain-containing protein [Candidatus Competibacterales bacterium]